MQIENRWESFRKSPVDSKEDFVNVITDQVHDWDPINKLTPTFIGVFFTTADILQKFRKKYS